MIDDFQNNENLEMFNYYNKTLKKKYYHFKKERVLKVILLDQN